MYKIFRATILLFISILLLPQLLNAQTPFTTCEKSYLISQSPNKKTPTSLYAATTISNPLNFVLLGTSTFRYNAIGFNPNDNFVYGIEINSNNLLRIGSSGVAVNLGAISGLPSNTNFNSGEIAPNGDYYVKNGSATTMYRIDIPSMTAVAVPLTGTSGSSGDLAWSNGSLLMITRSGSFNHTYNINPTTGAATLLGTSSVTSTFGALFGGTNGIYGSINSGNFYQINTVNGSRTLISAAPASTSNDGARCSMEPHVFNADLGITKTDGSATYVSGTNVVYTITASNTGPFGASEITVSDPFPAGITSGSWVCSATGGATCTPSGSGALNDTDLSLPVGGTAVYTVTLAIPPAFSGNLVNVATITPSNSTIDSNMANNTATDTDTQAGGPPIVALVKTCPTPIDCTNANQLPETDVVFSIEFTNSGFDPAQSISILDGIPPNTVFKLGSANASPGSTSISFVVEYSDDYDPLNPTAATYTYTPVSGGGGADPGYDKNVKAIRWRAISGTLSSNAPNNVGTVSFGAKIL